VVLKLKKNKLKHSFKGKNNPMYGRHHSKKTREIMSMQKSGKNNFNFGKHLSKEIREKISKGNKGKVVTYEQRKKISRALTGKHLPIEVRRKISKSNKGRKFSKETRKKISLAKSGKGNQYFGKHLPQSNKEKMSKSMKKIWETTEYRNKIRKRNPYHKHHVDLNRHNNEKNNILTMSNRRHQQLHRFAYHYIIKVLGIKEIYKYINGLIIIVPLYMTTKV